MRSLVADTHALVWHLTAPERLGKTARRLFAQADAGRATVHVPVVALVEISLLYERGRLRFGADRVVQLLARQPGWQVLALDIEQCLMFAALTGVKDPTDRLIAASAKALASPLVSADEGFDGIDGVERTWD